MRILFLTQVLPYPLDAGPKVRAYYTLRHLARVHELALLSFAREEDSPEAVAHLRQFCSAVWTVPMRRSRVKDVWHLARSLATADPFLVIRDRVPAMRAAVRRIVEERGPFDAIHADQLWMAPYALMARGLAPSGVVVQAVLDQHNAVFRLTARLAATDRNPLRRIGWRVEERKLRLYEARTCNRFDRVVWVTGEDREAMRPAGLRDGAGRRGVVIPIAVEPAPQPVDCRDRSRVTFIGGLHWPPNAEGMLWFREHVWPLVKTAAPGARLTAIGRHAGRVLKSSQTDGVEALSNVGLMPYLRETGVFVVPLLCGAGMRVKILDAWAGGLPVVSTRIGAEGLRAVDGTNMLLADTPEDFAGAVVRVLQEPDLAARLAREGRRTVEAYYDWRLVYRAWDEVYGCVSSSLLHTHQA